MKTLMFMKLTKCDPNLSDVYVNKGSQERIRVSVEKHDSLYYWELISRHLYDN